MGKFYNCALVCFYFVILSFFLAYLSCGFWGFFGYFDFITSYMRY
uniref:Uncharacterized protein n=1 Tax=Rhizophora mucronata TaxID=61149 RepID=A0A2P2QM87_RHIMU